MSGAVTLKIKEGRSKSKEMVFKSPARCFVGRARVCQLHFPSATVSRLHCLLDIDPPAIHIRDLGSRNGTFVNGELIGMREPQHTMEEAALEEQHEFTLHSGDQIGLGNLVLEVGVLETPPEKTPQETVAS
jgi:pSer/pThr/pTyr-binding forkhead associated (FHA) protein